MITQTAPKGEAHFVMTMAEHMQMCGQMARAFGNDQFARLDPYEEMMYVVDNHDRGWDEYDANPGLDDDQLPYIMSRTPTLENMKTNRVSPEFNEKHHSYCGLISSMHSWGLYNKRYGFSRFVVRARMTTSITVKNTYQPAVDAMLANEIERQKRLKAKLANDPRTASWAQDRRIIQSYKQLQFFDTLALYFNLYHATERGEQDYVHVPLNAEADATLTLRKVSDGVYSLAPFPFTSDRLKLVCPGRYAKPFPDGFDPSKVGEALRSMPADAQTYELIAA
jgi:Protein of unknown function (DUF3891)